ncbi:unnamed protein product [Lota lota]
MSSPSIVQVTNFMNVWTSDCCPLPLLNPSVTVEENGTSWQQACTNLGFSLPLTCPTHLCKACGSHFDPPAQKHVCGDCKNNFCGRCSVEPEALHPRLCRTCLQFHGTLFNRTQLMRLKVRELRDYLRLHEVPTDRCREKEELVELVLDQQAQGGAGVSGGGRSTAPNGATNGAGPRTQDTSPPQSSDENDEDDEDEEDDDEEDDEEEDEGDDNADEGEAEGDDEGVDENERVAEEDVGDDNQSWDTDEALPAEARTASLSDLSCVEDIEGLSVRQLKEILSRNFVNFMGCCEKWELMERVTRLYNEVRNEESATATKLDEDLCRICMDYPVDCVLLECGHMVTCSRCGKRMSECPICRQYIVRVVHVFRS